MQLTVSSNQLKQFADRFWAYVADGKVFAFHGPMGAGKTTLISALCHEKGVNDITSSPTFSIINEYVYQKNGHEESIYHIDLYRLNSTEEIIQAGVEDCMYSGSICMVEWPERAHGLFDEQTIHVYIQSVSETERSVEITLPQHS